MTDKIEEIIERDGFVLEMTVGNSMEPMLRNRQNPIVIEKITRKPRKNDVVLFKRDTGEYVLHRIVKVYMDGYFIRGDNRLYGDRDITDRHIIGILTGYYKGEKFIDCKKNLLYKIYSFLIVKYYYIRIFKIKIRSLFKK